MNMLIKRALFTNIEDPTGVLHKGTLCQESGNLPDVWVSIVDHWGQCHHNHFKICG